MMHRQRYKFAIPLCLLLSIAIQIGAKNTAPSEYAVKAAFLYNFTKFAEWPEDVLNNRDSLKICIFGTNPFGSNLDKTVAGKKAHSKPIKIIYTTEVNDIIDCQMVFLASNNKKQIEEALTAVTNLSIITVSDLPEFASNGGMIGFYIDDKRVRFEINRRAVHQSDLSFSSRLLKIARIVQEEE